MKYKAIICDIDDTLTLTGSHSVSSKVVNVIKMAQEKGIIFTFATARPLFLLGDLINHLNIKVLIITDNGAAIYDTIKKENIWETTLDSNQINEILPFFHKAKKKEIHVDTTNGSFLSDVKRVDPSIKAYKVVCISLTPDDADNLKLELESKFKNLTIVKAPSFTDPQLFSVFVAKPDATKQHAIIKLAEILQISSEEMIGIGDHYNDFPLLMACGLKVAMGNAVEDLKAIADYIAPSVDEDGVADVIEKFVLSANQT